MGKVKLPNTNYNIYHSKMAEFFANYTGEQNEKKKMLFGIFHLIPLY